MQFMRPIPVLITLIGAIVTGWLAWASSEVFPAVLSILVFGGLIGLLKPKLGPLLVVIVALGIPAFYVLSAALGFPSKWPPEPGPAATLIAIVPAFFAYGAGLAIGSLRYGSADANSDRA